MAYLLDTNIAIHFEEGNEHVMRKCAGHVDEMFLSAITLVELERAIYSEPEDLALHEKRLAALLRIAPVVAFDQAAAHTYGKIIRQLGLSRRRDFDRMIAAHAISIKSILVTNNASDFSDIPGLKMEDWT